ncbi:precorrin-2 dehydrogenase/sirohydrochlorin ferrochelatase family protein [Lentilactobacillus kosonis]|uniref:precorrin-2 dehydrogenase n=1 Tax=Lentilactobacillus kosonis TaxID=2810561 RepID=A0A401FMS9_9LACO|nr:bifunctional precorrin-2 dehydrogenase/sirohydrochlorin ferrochelatase [Lentilactobacillus kosonis]GAY73643.1 siroheme synthase [Lentilactobacillus kosonis]
MKEPYPILIDIANKKIAVVGGGNVAARKVAGLLAKNAKVTVISPAISDKIDSAKVTWIKKKYERSLVENMELIFACTDNNDVNEQIVAEASQFQLVNNTSNKQQSSFYNLAVIEENGIMITVSTNGDSPSKAKQIKNKIKQWLSSSLS